MKCRFTKISNSHERLRTDVIEGYWTYPPKVGQQFFMTSEALEGPGVRYLSTSPVVSRDVVDDGAFLIETESGSVYKIELIEENE